MTTQITEFKTVDAALSILKKNYSVVPDCNTKEGYNECKSGIKELTSYRSSLTATHKELKAPVLARGRLLDGEKNRIESALKEIEEPLRSAKKAKDDEKERIEAQRIADIEDKIAGIRSFESCARGAQSKVVADLLEQLHSIEINEPDFQEFAIKAYEAKNEAAESLQQLYNDAVIREANESKQAELDALLEQAKKQPEPEPVTFEGLGSTSAFIDEFTEDQTDLGSDDVAAQALLSAVPSISVTDAYLIIKAIQNEKVTHVQFTG